MNENRPSVISTRRGRYVVAMMLGTALTAFGPAKSEARSTPDVQAIREMTKYCTACWRNARLQPDSWSDCTQEVLCRLLERVAPDAWGCVLKNEGDERREFLRAIDTVKKREQRARRWAQTNAEEFADDRDQCQKRWADHRNWLQTIAPSVLTDRQQQILRLSLDGWSVHEIARELKLPAPRVSDEKYKMTNRLKQKFEAGDQANL